MQRRWWRGLLALASLRLTMVGLAALLLAAVFAQGDNVPAVWPLVVPLALLAVNLLAAIVSNPKFRAQPPLLVFHLALLLVVLLAAVGRLTYLEGRIELTEGEAFEGVPLDTRAGRFHRGLLSSLRFQSESLEIDYSAYGAINEMRNRVRWADEGGRWREGELRIQQPLIIGGYRIYLTSGKGFAAMFDWQPTNASPLSGSVHLAAFPAHADNQTAEWSLSGRTVPVWLKLVPQGEILPEGQAARLLPPPRHHLVVRSGDVRQQVAPGESVIFPEGKLIYNGLRLWMGYRVFYDWTAPWLLAAALLAVMAMAWHFWARFARRPWDG